MLDLALGVALYAQPPHVKFPGLAAVAIARSLLRKRRRRAETNSTSDSQGKEDDGVEVRWKGLTSSLHKKRTRKTKSDADAPRVILSEVSGVARPGRFLALLGPSGSGKTSLLNALAGQTPADEKLRLTGALAFNGVAVDGGDAHRERVAYVRQQDVFYSELTVRETLVNAAKMRDVADVDAETEKILRAVGLTKCADSRVGDQKTRGGISGGERKRLALACELVGNAKAIVCADEPTSGLDAFQAQRVVASLKKLCKSDDAASGNTRRTVIASVHQPRSSIVSMFDDVCVLAHGRVVYCGPLEDTVCAKWFAAQGFPSPQTRTSRNFSSTWRPSTRRTRRAN